MSFNKRTFAFLAKLAEHNDREWFNANKARYESDVREPARAFIRAIGERLGIREDQVFVNIQRVGNTSSASIPIALDEAVTTGRLRADDTVLMSAFGAGLTWGAALVRWCY